MLEELRKKSLKKERVSQIICIIIGVALIVAFAKETIMLIKGPTAFESLTNEEITADKYVKATVWFSLGCYEEDYTKYTNTNKRRTDWLYYIIRTEDMNQVAYIGLRVPAKEEETMGVIVDTSFQILMDNYPENYDYEKVYTGTITKMEDNRYDNMTVFFRNMGYTEEELRTYFLPYFIKEGFVGNKRVELVILAEVAGVLILLYCLFRYLRLRAGKNQKHLIKAIKKDGEGAMDIAEKDYIAAKALANDTKIGKIYTYYWNKNKTYAVKNAQLVWAYLHKTTHTTNGIKTGTSYEVMMYDKDKKAHHIGVSNEASANSILEYLVNTFPNILVGYDDEVARMFRKDFNSFLDLRYNRAESFSQEIETEDNLTEQPADDPFAQTTSSDDPFAQTASSDDPFEAYFSRQKEQENNKKE